LRGSNRYLATRRYLIKAFFVAGNRKISVGAICLDFEKQVAAELMIVNLNPSNDDSTDVDLIANSIYSYECVRSAAQAVFDRDGS
jgi:hypothetical protein